MEKIQVKLVLIIIAIFAMLFLLPIQVLGTNEEMQMIKTNDEDYIIYIKELQNTSFEFAITQSFDTEEIDRNYQSAEDGSGNHVVFIAKERYQEISGKSNYLFVKKDGKLIIEGKKLDFSQFFTTQNMEQVELTSRKIETQLVTDIIEKDEEINGVKVRITIGGLKIKAKENSSYYYAITKLPLERYDNLKELADKINTDYEKSDMYSKIDISKQFYSLSNDLANEQVWKQVDNYTILQPSDAKKGDQYVVYIKEVDENQNETVDVKFMTSYREDEEEKIPGRTENKIVKETTKLPITGDTIILFVILAVIVAATVIVFIRMKKLQNARTDRR